MTKLPKDVQKIPEELTKEQISKIVTIANTNLLVGLIQATETQMDYLSSREFKGTTKHQFKIFRNLSTKFVDTWRNDTPASSQESDKISEEIHELLYKSREAMVKRYIDFSLGDEDAVKVD